MVIIPAVLLVVASTGAVAAAEAPKTAVSEVVAVVDGDTIKVRIGDHTETVRYIGVNAPEMRQSTRGEEPGAREATEATRKLVEGQTVPPLEDEASRFW